jgi:hypothetical protein
MEGSPGRFKDRLEVGWTGYGVTRTRKPSKYEREKEAVKNVEERRQKE